MHTFLYLLRLVHILLSAFRSFWKHHFSQMPVRWPQGVARNCLQICREVDAPWISKQTILILDSSARGCVFIFGCLYFIHFHRFCHRLPFFWTGCWNTIEISPHCVASWRQTTYLKGAQRGGAWSCLHLVYQTLFTPQRGGWGVGEGTSKVGRAGEGDGGGTEVGM